MHEFSPGRATTLCCASGKLQEFSVLQSHMGLHVRTTAVCAATEPHRAVRAGDRLQEIGPLLCSYLGIEKTKTEDVAEEELSPGTFSPTPTKDRFQSGIMKNEPQDNGTAVGIIIMY